MAGGELREHDAAAFGAGAIDFVKSFDVRFAVLSMWAVHPEKGFMVYHLCEAEFSRAAIGQAERCIVAADCSKFERRSLVQVCNLATADMLVTDSAPDSRLARKLADADVEVLVTEPASAYDAAD